MGTAIVAREQAVASAQGDWEAILPISAKK
jgi:hypothetical protein